MKLNLINYLAILIIFCDFYGQNNGEKMRRRKLRQHKVPCLVNMCTNRFTQLLEEHGTEPSSSVDYCILLKVGNGESWFGILWRIPGIYPICEAKILEIRSLIIPVSKTLNVFYVLIFKIFFFCYVKPKICG